MERRPADPDVIVQDTGGIRNKIIDAYCPGIAIEDATKHAGEILKVTPVSYVDIGNPLNFPNVTELSIKFGNGESVEWKLDWKDGGKTKPRTLVVKFAGGHPNGSNDHWGADDEIGKLDLTWTDGSPQTPYSNNKVEKFTLHLHLQQ
jgi:hypothetical protein